MKSRFSIVFCALSLALVLACGAAEVPPEDAARAAEAWCSANAGGLADGASAVSVRSEVATNGILLWHEVSMADGGCAFVAPDDRINPVIAYVPNFEGPLPPGHPLRAMLEADLGKRLATIKDEGTAAPCRTVRAADGSAGRGVAASVARAQSRWGELRKARKGARAAAAATPSTVHSFIEGWAVGRLDHWNQNGWNRYGSWDNLYDLYTPEHYPCGCVATAGAALLQHFGVTRVPAKTNTCEVDGTETTLSTKGRAYDWSLLPETWSQNQALSEAQIDLLGRATYDMGVCLGMSYRSGGSSASISTLASSLRSDFGLADARCFFSGVSAANYPKLVYHQLRAGAPVVLSLSGAPGGHAVLAVGCGEDDAGLAYVRVFMGWGGTSDGWYQLPEVEEFTTLDGVVTMIGADAATLALCGRVTAADGSPAAFEHVSVSGVASAETETDANGFWGVRVKPAAGLVTVSCAGAEATAEVGAAAAATGGSVGAAALAAALPDAIDLVAGQTDGLTAYSSPAAARLAALRQGKLLFLQMGAEWCAPCRSLREYLKGLGSAFTDDFVFCYLDTDKNAYGFDDDTFSGIPAWAVIDPRRFDPADHWTSEGIFHKASGYSASTVDYWLDYGRTQWKTLGAPPTALVADAPATLAMPKALQATLRFPDGTECDVTGAVSWSLVSGTAATLSGNMLSPVAGASGDVAVRCEGTFWGTPFSAGATVRVIGGVALEALEIEGPDIFDLYDEPSAQFSAVAVFSDGSRAEVDAEWSAETTGKAYGLQCSEEGLLSFSRNTYTVYQSVTVTVSAVSSGLGASRDVLVYGPGYVMPVSVVFSQDALWPGAEVSLVPQKVQWWRHGVLEPPTDDFTDVEFSWEMYCYPGGWRTGSGTNLTVPSDVASTNGSPFVTLCATPKRERYYDEDYYDYRYCPWYAAPTDLLAVDFDGNGGTPSVSRVLRTPGSKLGTLPEATRRGYLFDGWIREADGVKPTAYTIVNNSFSCKAKWLEIASVDVFGPSAATAESKFALLATLADGSTRVVTNGVVWTRVSGDAATVSADGTFVPVPGKTGDVELRATATVGGNGYSLSRTVHVIDPSAVRSLRVEGPELIDLYDVPGGLYRAFAATADGEYEVTPAWSADGIGTRYMQISAVGELSFYYDTYTVYQCATAVVTAAYCGLTSSAQTLLYGPGYVTPVQVGIEQNAIWPGAEVKLVPRKVQWWRHGVLEEPTDDLSDVAFSWELYCAGSGRDYGNGTAVTVPADALSTNGTAVLYLNAIPARERYWDERYQRFDVNFLDASPAGWTTITFDPAGGEVSPESARYVPGLPYRFLPTPSKTGYSGGWYTEREGGDSVTDDSTVPSADTTLHAHWSANYYWIVFDANGAEGTMSDQYFYYDRPGRLRSNAFTMEGDTFAGWALSPEGEVVFADGAEILNLRDTYDTVTLYAVWPRNVFVDIALDPNGGSVSPAKQRAVMGKALKTLPLPKWTGHAFAGWYTAAEGGTHVRTGMRVPGPATLYAHWVEGAAPAFTNFAITNSATAIATAIRENKLLFVLHGADWCSYCHVVESWLAARWAELQSDFTVYYCDGDYDDTISGSYPEYGVFDPAAFAGNWSTGCYAHITGGSDERVEKVVADALANSGRLGTWESGLSRLPDGATAAEVTAAIAAAGFADPVIARAVAGNPATFNALVEWASAVKAADGTSPAGTAAVVADPHSAVAFLLGAERLFHDAPSVLIESIGFGGGNPGALSLQVAVRDGTTVVPVSAEKVGAMFEASDSPSGWTDASASGVDSSGTDADGRMHFEIRPPGTAPGRVFLRLRK